MSTDNNIWSLAEVYVSGKMPGTEQDALQHRLATDPAFATEFNECLNMLRSLEGFGAYSRFQNMLQDVRSKQSDVKTPSPARTIPLRTHYLRTAAVAAGIALLTTFSTFWILNHRKSNATQYNVLSRK